MSGVVKTFVGSFKKYAVWKGRAPRSEFFIFSVVSTAITVLAAFVDDYLGSTVMHFNTTGRDLAVLEWIAQLVFVLPGIAVLVRRLHDLNLSAWWALLPQGIALVVISSLNKFPMLAIIAGIVALLFLFLLFFISGSEQANKYGDPVVVELEVSDTLLIVLLLIATIISMSFARELIMSVGSVVR